MFGFNITNNQIAVKLLVKINLFYFPLAGFARDGDHLQVPAPPPSFRKCPPLLPQVPAPNRPSLSPAGACASPPSACRCLPLPAPSPRRCLTPPPFLVSACPPP